MIVVMFIGVISDTHGHIEFTDSAIRQLEEHSVERVLHCGDIGCEEIVSLFSAYPTHFVFGNVDHARDTMREAIETAGHTCHDEFGTVEWAGRKIAFLHGDDTSRLNESIRAQDWDLVCHGHTHSRRLESVGRTLVLNPGAVYRANPRSIAIADLSTMDIRHISL